MVFFEDEAAFGRMNHVRKCWVHRPDRAIVKSKQLDNNFMPLQQFALKPEKPVQLFHPFVIQKLSHTIRQAQGGTPR